MKHWLKSKTIWLNASVAALAAAEASFGLLKPYLGESVYGVALFIVTIANVYLRFVTTQPVAGAKTVEKPVQ